MSRRFSKTMVGVGLIGGPLLTLLSAIVSPAIKSDVAAQLAVIADHPGRYYAFTILTMAGAMLLVPGILGLMQMTRARAARWGDAGGTLALAGILIAIGDATSQLVIWQMAAPGADRGQMAAVLDRFDGTLGSSLVFTIGGLAVLAGFAVLAIGLHRARAVPPLVAAGIPVGMFLNIAGFAAASVGILIVSSVVLLASLGWIGWRVLARSADPQEHGVVPAPAGARLVPADRY